MTSDRRPYYAQLKKNDLELAYLAALTLEGLKPVSRWEKAIALVQLAPLDDLGLVYRQVTGDATCRRLPLWLSPCCIEAYIQQPYAPNDLAKEDLNLFFHWPCPDCRISQALRPLYRDILTFIQTCGN